MTIINQLSKEKRIEIFFLELFYESSMNFNSQFSKN